MDAREYMRELDRMLRAEGKPDKYSKRECYRADCCGCPLYSDGTEMEFCGCLLVYDKAVDIVEKWAEANPRKTIQSVFLENYPHGKPTFCANVLGYGIICESMDNCEKCWQTPIDELEEK